MANNKERTPEMIRSEIDDNIKYAIGIVSGGIAALKESDIAKHFDGKVPDLVELDAVPMAINAAVVDKHPSIDPQKLLKGLVVVCMAFRHHTVNEFFDNITEQFNKEDDND